MIPLLDSRSDFLRPDVTGNQVEIRVKVVTACRFERSDLRELGASVYQLCGQHPVQFEALQEYDHRPVFFQVLQAESKSQSDQSLCFAGLVFCWLVVQSPLCRLHCACSLQVEDFVQVLGFLRCFLPFTYYKSDHSHLGDNRWKTSPVVSWCRGSRRAVGWLEVEVIVSKEAGSRLGNCFAP